MTSQQTPPEDHGRPYRAMPEVRTKPHECTEDAAAFRHIDPYGVGTAASISVLPAKIVKHARGMVVKPPRVLRRPICNALITGYFFRPCPEDCYLECARDAHTCTEPSWGRSRGLQGHEGRRLPGQQRGRAIGSMNVSADAAHAGHLLLIQRSGIQGLEIVFHLLGR